MVCVASSQSCSYAMTVSTGGSGQRYSQAAAAVVLERLTHSQWKTRETPISAPISPSPVPATTSAADTLNCSQSHVTCTVCLNYPTEYACTQQLTVKRKLNSWMAVCLERSFKARHMPAVPSSSMRLNIHAMLLPNWLA